MKADDGGAHSYVLDELLPVVRDAIGEGGVPDPVLVGHGLGPAPRLGGEAGVHGEGGQALGGPQSIDVGHEARLLGGGVSLGRGHGDNSSGYERSQHAEQKLLHLVLSASGRLVPRGDQAAPRRTKNDVPFGSSAAIPTRGSGGVRRPVAWRDPGFPAGAV